MPTLVSLPDVGWAEALFDPVRPRATDRMEGRRTEMQEVGTAWWQARYTPRFLEPRDFGRMDAFMMRAGDGGEVFAAYDPFRPRPIRMDSGAPLSGTKAGTSTAFDGSATLNSITNSRVIVVGGLPAGFLFSAGDYLEVRRSTFVRSLHRIMADVAASGAGVATLSIKHGLDTQIFTAANSIIQLEKPSCLMQIDPGSYQGAKSWASRQPSFSATEVFFAP